MFRSRRTPDDDVFLLMDRAKAGARAKGLPITDLSIGASDLPPPPEALEALKAALDDPSTYGYCLRSATLPFLQAATDWYARRYQVQLDPQREALSLIGAQEGLAHLLMAVADPGDGLLMTSVAYPSYFGAARIAGLEPLFVPLDEQFLPDFSAVSAAQARRAKAMLLNYPNNPTAAVATEKFFEQALEFCQQHDLLLIHDNPYLDQVFAGQAPSPLALPGGRERVVELFSFAKSYHLAGFRLGFALGNAAAIASLEAVKGAIDFNQYRGIQRMGMAALNLPPERLRQDAQVWQARGQAMSQALKAAGWNVPPPKACMYLWAKLPGGLDDVKFCLDLSANTGVALAPGQGFGPGGKGYVRIALVRPEAALREAAEKIGGFLRQLSLPS
jgi:aspartate/methionine/tyrosine aminotransferase